MSTRPLPEMVGILQDQHIPKYVEGDKEDLDSYTILYQEIGCWRMAPDVDKYPPLLIHFYLSVLIGGDNSLWIPPPLIHWFKLFLFVLNMLK